MPTAKVPEKAPKRAPKKPPTTLSGKPLKRESIIKVRMTADQRLTMERSARKEGLDLSSWIRMVALRAGGYLEDK